MCGSVAICWLLLLAQRTQASPHPIGYHLHKLPLGPLLYLRDYLDDTNGLQPMMTIRAHCLQTAPETQTHPDMASVQSTMHYAYGQHTLCISKVWRRAKVLFCHSASAAETASSAATLGTQLRNQSG